MSRLSARMVVVTGATALALVAAGTIAGAAITAGPVDSSGVVHGCYGQANADGTTHDVVLQNAGTTCPANMTPITWNQTGPQGPVGQTGATGAAGPAGPAGPAGAVGPAGPPGSDGNTVLNGTGAPAASLGHDGDFYVDTAAGVLYGPKTGGAWPATGTSLVGQAGPQGPTGPRGATGPQGPAGDAGLLPFQVDAGVQMLAHASTFIPVPGLSEQVTQTADSTYLLNADIRLLADHSDTVNCGVFEDGSLGANAPATASVDTSAASAMIPINTLLFVPAGTHTIEIRCFTSVGDVQISAIMNGIKVAAGFIPTTG